jgi:site-specific DNA recombinase
MIGIYCRISRIKEGNDLSIDDQKQKGIAKADALGLKYKLYIDEGLSGASHKIEDRPEFERFLGDVSQGNLTHVYAFDQSRFERNPQIRFAINNIFKNNNVIYITEMDGVVDLHDPQAEFFGDLLSVINKYHVTTTKLKVKSVLTMRAKEGKGKGTLPYGYTMANDGMIIISEDEALNVKRVYELSLKGLGCNAISHIFNEENIKTVYTTKAKAKDVKSDTKFRWSPSSIRNLITNTFYKGERQYNGEKLSVPAIIDPLYWQQVNDHLPLNRNNSGKKVTHQFLLKNILKCGVCGKSMYGKKRLSNGDNHYNCASKRYKGDGCTNKGINIDRIERFIWEHLFAKEGLAQRIEKEFTFDDNNLRELESKISFHKENLDRLSNERSKAIGLVVKGIVNESDVASIITNIDSQTKGERVSLEDAEQKYMAFKVSDDLVERYRNTFSKFSELTTFEQKKEIINNFIHSITLLWLGDKKEFLIDIRYRVEIPNDLYLNKSSVRSDDYYKHYDESDTDDAIVYTYPTEKGSQSMWVWEDQDEDLHINTSQVGELVEGGGAIIPHNYIGHPCF